MPHPHLICPSLHPHLGQAQGFGALKTHMSSVFKSIRDSRPLFHNGLHLFLYYLSPGLNKDLFLPGMYAKKKKGTCSHDQANWPLECQVQTSCLKSVADSLPSTLREPHPWSLLEASLPSKLQHTAAGHSRLLHVSLV